MKKLIARISFGIIPLFVLLIAYKLRHYFGLSHTIGADPEYMYLFNGLNVATLNLKIWHIDNPGTTVQVLSGLIIRVISLFRESKDLISDVLQNPEIYLSSILNFFFIIVAGLNYFIGLLVFKYSKNLQLTIISQLSLFLSEITISTMFRIGVEYGLILSIYPFAILLLYMILNEYSTRHIIILSIFTGLALASKINSMVILIIPLIFLEKRKEKLIYSISSICLFLVFAFPVTLQLKRYYFWIRKLIMHSGRYGGGSENFLDVNYFYANFKHLVSANPILTGLLIILILVVIIYYIPYLKNLLFINNNKYRSALLGFLISYLFLIFIVCKHYAFYYLLPMLLLANFSLIVILLSLKNNFIRNIIALATIIVISVNQFNKTSTLLEGYEKRISSLKTTSDYVEEHFSNRKTPLLMIPNYYGNAFKEYAMFFGSWWSGPGKREKVYQSYLKDIYPDSYIYNPVEKYFHFWGEKITAEEILSKHDELIVSVGWQMEEPFNDAKQILDSVNIPYTLSLIYENKESVEQIFMLEKKEADME